MSIDLTGPLKPEVLKDLEALSIEADRYLQNRHPGDSLTWRYLASIQALLIRLHNKYDSAANSNHSLLSAAAPDLLAACKALMLTHHGYHLGAGPCVCHAHEAARLAIAKAEGK